MRFPSEAYTGKRVLVTGHTGFKGSWLCEWLLSVEADVAGYSLPPPTSPALFDQLGLRNRLRHTIGDVRDGAAVRRAILDFQPDVVFHLAAQPLVRLSYREPVETYATNVMGTIHVLEALRVLEKHCAAVLITTDKCYENREWLHGYREEDPLGGHDPYSSSKAAAEIAIASWRRSFFPLQDGGFGNTVAVASARAGNVVGGGDWALDRIVPDCMRALAKGEPVAVRNPQATRPWQHVLEPLSGYLLLAAEMHSVLDEKPGEQRAARLQRLCGAFNFGPGLDSNRSVRELVEEVLRNWPGGKWEDRTRHGMLHEASLLNLATDKAHHVLGWRARWGFAETVRRTVEWYRAATAPGQDAAALIALTREQIAAYGG